MSDMEIHITDKLKVLVRSLAQTCRMPTLRQKGAHFLCPIESTRYTEFAYLLRFIEELDARPKRILDVSSPFELAYILSCGAEVVKTDINPYEGTRISPDKSLSFQEEDATRLSFEDESFDLVYSISVIEHIYDGWQNAVREMLRVLRPGGLLYLTFPVAPHKVEEWVDAPIYSHQNVRDGRVFFQYRFGPEEVAELQTGFDEAESVDLSIFWERREGAYDRTVKLLRRPIRQKLLLEFRKALINLRAGFTLLDDLPADFSRARSFGNASLLMRKRA